MKLHKRTPRFLALAMFAGALALGTTAFALEIHNVEVDGNIIANSGNGDATLDWASSNDSIDDCIINESALGLGVCIGLPGSILIEDPTSAKGALDPDTHAGGDKLDDPSNWSIIEGNVPKKDDLGKIYAVVIEDATTSVFTGWEREVNNGDSYVDFSFFETLVSCEDTSGNGIFEPSECTPCQDGTNIDGSEGTLDGAFDDAECPFPGPGGADGTYGYTEGDLVFSQKLGTNQGGSDLPDEIRLILLEAGNDGMLDLVNPLLDLSIFADGFENHNTATTGSSPNLTDLGNGQDLSGLLESSLCGGLCPTGTLIIGINDQEIAAGPWGTEQSNNQLPAGAVRLEQLR